MEIKNNHFVFGVFLFCLLIFYFVNNSYKSIWEISNLKQEEQIEALMIRVDYVHDRTDYEITDKFEVAELKENLSEIELRWSGSYSSMIPFDYGDPIVTVYIGNKNIFSITSKGDVYIQNKRYIIKDYQGKQVYANLMAIDSKITMDLP